MALGRRLLVESPCELPERWRAIVAEVFPAVADGEGLFAALWDHFADPRHWAAYDDVAEIGRAHV